MEGNRAFLQRQPSTVSLQHEKESLVKGCHLPHAPIVLCFLIPPAGLVNSPLIRMQIPLIRLIHQGLFSCDQGID